MRAFRATLAAIVCLGVAASAWAGDPEADKKFLKRIYYEMDLVPSLYAKDNGGVKFGELPKFTAKKLEPYYFGKKEIFALERDKWKEGKERYVRDFPLRAAIFEAQAEVSNAQDLKVPIMLEAAALPKPADVVKLQESIGKELFQLEAVHRRMQEASEQRAKEKTKRWQADFDFAMARLESDLIFLYEYNYLQGQVRADKLPKLAAGDKGWKITFVPKATVSEPKAKDLAKARRVLLERVEKDHVDTPWAYFASRESKLELGMEWKATRK